MYCFKFLNTEIEVDQSWKDLFENSNEFLRDIEFFLENREVRYTPRVNNIFRSFRNPVDQFELIVVGQDPYYQEGIATGRAFEVNDLVTWNNPIQTSLLTLIKAVHKGYTEIDNPESIGNIRGQLGRIIDLRPPNEVFDQWERNGILFLNTALTCEVNEPNSHSFIWCGFAQNMIRYIASKSHTKQWLMCGKEARRFLPIVIQQEQDNTLVAGGYEFSHPRQNDFSREPVTQMNENLFFNNVIWNI